MIRLLCYISLFFLLMNSLAAQESGNEKRPKIEDKSFFPGNIYLSAGYGFPNLGKLNFLFKYWSVEENADSSYLASGLPKPKFTVFSGIGPVNLKGEYAYSKFFGFGLSVNYVRANMIWEEYFYGANGSTININKNVLFYQSLSVLFRANFHFVRHRKVNMYCGTGLGYRYNEYFHRDAFGSRKREESLLLENPFAFELSLGMRYWLKPNWGLYVEAGATKSLIQAGIVGKF